MSGATWPTDDGAIVGWKDIKVCLPSIRDFILFGVVLSRHLGSIQAVQLIRRFVISGALDGRVKGILPMQLLMRDGGSCGLLITRIG